MTVLIVKHVDLEGPGVIEDGERKKENPT